MYKTFTQADVLTVEKRQWFSITIYLLLLTLVIPLMTVSRGSAQSPAKVDSVSRRLVNIDAQLAAIEKAVDKRRQELGIPGLALAIVKDDKVIFSKGFGTRDVKKQLPVTTETLFAIGSTTKAFTAMTVLMSADDGKLSLDDSPKKLLPFFALRDPEANSGVTIRDLLTHRVGLDRTDFLLQFSGSLTREDIIRIAGIAKPTAKFRERFQYQNVMFVAAGEAAAKANGMSWEKLVKTKIFQPLLMNGTKVSIAEMQKDKDHSLGYEYNEETKEAKHLKMVDLAKIAPAGAINSNAKDMAQWLKLLLGGGVYGGKRFVSEKNFNELFTPQIQIAPKVSYGLGWFVREWNGKKSIDHAGNIDGFNAVVALVPEERLGLVLLSNVTASPLTSEIREIVFSNLLGEPEKKAAAPKKAPPVNTGNSSLASKGEASPVLQEILGNYETETKGTPIDIVLSGKAATFVMQGQPPRRLVEKEKDVFAIEGLPENYTLVVNRGKNGNIKNLAFNQRDGATILRSVKLPPDAPSAEEVMRRVIEASGGETNLRRHSSMQMETTMDLEYEGIIGELTVNAKAPNLSVSRTRYFALGKQIGETFDYFDGASGGSYTKDNKSIVGTPRKFGGEVLEDARIAADFFPQLNWKNLYKTVELKKISKVAGEDVYVVVKTPEKGNPVTDYISQKTFLVLRRETTQPGGGNQRVPYFDNFSDFKEIDGVILPFKITSGVPNSRATTVIVKSIKFNTAAPSSMFRPATGITELH